MIVQKKTIEKDRIWDLKSQRYITAQQAKSALHTCGYEVYKYAANACVNASVRIGQRSTHTFAMCHVFNTHK